MYIIYIIYIYMKKSCIHTTRWWFLEPRFLPRFSAPRRSAQEEITMSLERKGADAVNDAPAVPAAPAPEAPAPPEPSPPPEEAAPPEPEEKEEEEKAETWKQLVYDIHYQLVYISQISIFDITNITS